MSLFDLSGKSVLITGATKGIGRGIAHRMAEAGAKLVVSSRDQSACDEFASDLNQKYGEGETIAKGFACDLNEREQLEPLANFAVKQWDGLDILVCNAAVLPFMGPSRDTPPEKFDRILISNQHHNFRLCQFARTGMAKKGGGRIILIGSASGLSSSPNVMAYAIAKAGLTHMSRCLADEFAADNITVNCVAPGLIRSFSSRPLWEDEGILNEVVSDIPLQRIGEPEDVAGAVIFLASSAGAYVTGATIPVDGGRTTLSADRNHKLASDSIMSGTVFE